MGIFSDIFNDTDENKINRWVDKLAVYFEKNFHEDQYYVDEDDVIWFEEGSAVVSIDFVFNEEGNGFVKLESPLVYLPKDNLLPFYRKLLDINQEYISIGALGTSKNVVYLSCFLSVTNLRDEASFEYLVSVAVAADDLDDKLIDEFGVKRYEFEE